MICEEPAIGAGSLYLKRREIVKGYSWLTQVVSISKVTALFFIDLKT